MAIILRNQNNTNFTTVDNYFIKDKNLSTNSKGLLIQLLALPDNWQFSKKGICSIVKEGQTYVNSCIKELKELGYLTIDKYPNNKVTGKFEYEYKIYSIPYFCKYLEDGTIVNMQTKKIGRDTDCCVNENELKDKIYDINCSLLLGILLNLEFKGTLDELKKYLPVRLQLSNRALARMIRQNENTLVSMNRLCKLVKTKKGLLFEIGDDKKTENSNNLVSSPPNCKVTIPDTENLSMVPSPKIQEKSILHNKDDVVTIPDIEKPPMVPSPTDEKVTIPDTDSPVMVNHTLYKRMNIQNIRKIEKGVKEQIKYAELTQEFTSDKEISLLEGIVEIMVDVYCSDDYLKIGKEYYLSERVKNNYRRIEKEHIKFIISNIVKSTSNITNSYAYLLKSLFTASHSLKISSHAKKSLLPEWYENVCDEEPTPEILERALKLQQKLRDGC